MAKHAVLLTRRRLVTLGPDLVIKPVSDIMDVLELAKPDCATTFYVETIDLFGRPCGLEQIEWNDSDVRFAESLDTSSVQAVAAFIVDRMLSKVKHK